MFEPVFFRLSVKSVIERACGAETLEETSPELRNFCTIMEHILSHRLKRSWLFGPLENKLVPSRSHGTWGGRR